jgi:hypothetical protein
MKRFIVSLLLSASLLQGCHVVKQLLSPGEAEGAIRELLSIGSEFGGNLLGRNGGLGNDLLGSILPQDLGKLLNTLQNLGLGGEITRFNSTLTQAAQQTVTRSVPIFLQGIRRMNIRDAVNIVRNGGHSATDYLRLTIGDSLRRAVTPVMGTALEEYKLVSQWEKLVAPAKLVMGNRLNLDIANLASGLVCNQLFNKIEEKEIAIRSRAEERRSALLQKVFGTNWGQGGGQATGAAF